MITSAEYDEGYRAYLDGESIGANPYAAGYDGALHTEWRKGWIAARDETATGAN